MVGHSELSMQFVILTIVVFSTASNAQSTSRVELIDMVTCESIAAQWREQQQGTFRVISATCERPVAQRH